jgi:hypothetical protein
MILRRITEIKTQLFRTSTKALGLEGWVSGTLDRETRTKDLESVKLSKTG